MTTKTFDSPIRLAHGGHQRRADGMCFNEAVAFAAGEKHGAMPDCASPVIRRFGMSLNDRLNDEDRQRLRPFILRSIGTAGDGREEERKRMCAEWLLDRLPKVYEKAGLSKEAEEIRALKAENQDALLENLSRVLYSARNAAWKARSDARARLRDRVKEAVRAEFEKRGITGYAAAAAAAAAADAAYAADAAAAYAAYVADAAADAAVAYAADAADVVADVVAADAAAAYAAYVADAAADAAVAYAADVADVVADVADAAAYAAAAYAADVAAYAQIDPSKPIYDQVYKAVRAKLEPIMRQKMDELFGGEKQAALDSALALFDRMLPPVPLQPAKVKNVKILFGPLEAEAA